MSAALPREAEVAVIGGGIAGLACALELLDAGRDVLLLEASGRVGGPVDSVRRQGFLLERGPSTVRAVPALDALLARVGLVPVHARRGSPYAVLDGRLVRIPPSPGALLRGELLPLRGWIELCGEPFRKHPPGPRSVHALVRERLGPQAAERLADLLTLGVWGMPADEVGFESAFPALADDLARAGSFTRLALGRMLARRGARAPRGGIVSTAEGLLALPQGLQQRLGERIALSSPAERVERREGGYDVVVGSDGARVRARHLVLAVPPAQAAKLVCDPQSEQLLRAYTSAPQTLAAFTTDEPGVADRFPGFGFLAPSRERLPLLGALFPSYMFPERAPAGSLLLSVFVGPALRNAPEREIADAIGPVLRSLLGASRAPALLDVARHPAGIVCYDVGHRERTRALRARLAVLGGPLLAGAPYDGVAFGAAAAAGLAAARAIRDVPPASHARVE